MLQQVIIFLFFYLSSFILTEETSPPLSPAEEMAHFQLAEGFEIELVAAEPLVQDPVYSTFDEMGRLWVIEMRNYMPDIVGTNELDPVGRVKYLEDTNADGKMDKATLFADSLILPRAIQFYPDGVLIAENIPLWFYQDLDADGHADTRTLVDSTYGGGGLPEHSANGLLWGLDNWLYNAKSKFRYKRQGNTWLKEETEFRGQWGITQDNYGRLVYNYNWSQMHGDQVPPNYFGRNPNHEPTTGLDFGLTNERRVYPSRPTPAVNRGYIPGVLDAKGSLMEFTSACSPFVYRGGHLGKDFEENVLVCEPAGNLIKRNTMKWESVSPEGKNPYPNYDFLTATDERFRPVHLHSGPDGALYITDMYRGLSQHGAYMTEYLKKVSLERGLDKHIHLGRIWRIKRKGESLQHSLLPGKANLSEKVAMLQSENAWYRDTAQRLLVQGNENETPNLVATLLSNSTNALGLIHAMHTLAALGATAVDKTTALLAHPNPFVASHALRNLENAISDKQLQNVLFKVILKQINSTQKPYALQVLLSSSLFTPPQQYTLIENILVQFEGEALLRDAAMSALYKRESELLFYLLEHKNWQKLNADKSIFMEQLSAAILKSQEKQSIKMVLSYLNQHANEAVINGLHTAALGIEKNAIVLENAEAIISNFNRADPRIHDLLEVLKWEGKKEEKQASTRTIVLNAEGKKQYAAGRQLFQTYCSGCHGADGKGVKRFAPPLLNSEWVVGNEQRTILILLHGIEGAITVNGHRYDVPEILPVMPAHSTLADSDLANIITYIRNDWGHEAEPTGRRTVGMLRLQTQGKVLPWSAELLLDKTKENE